MLPEIMYTGSRQRTKFARRIKVLLILALLADMVTPGSTSSAIASFFATQLMMPFYPVVEMTPPPRSAKAQQISFIKGISFPSENSQPLVKPLATQSLSDLKATGADWVAIYTVVYQKNISSTSIVEPNPSVTDANLVYAIQEAHRLGLKVLVKPHIDLTQDRWHWRGQIGFYFSDSQWRQWFISYAQMISHFAALAELNHADMFCVGTELTIAQQQERYFRQVVADVSNIYHGPLTYAGNWNAFETVKWWDAVDVMGVDAYFPLTVWSNPSLKDLENGWQPHIQFLNQFSKMWNRQVIFTEVGYTSQKWAAEMPMSWEAGKLDLQIQADLYQALFNQVFNQPWFSGLFIWSWESTPYQGGDQDTGYTPKGKPAGEILKQAFNTTSK